MQETLTYAALLRLPGAMTRKQKVERVDTVLEALGLTKSKDTIIGKHLCCMQHAAVPVWHAACRALPDVLHVGGLHTM
jgi:hypothetical protein